MANILALDSSTDACSVALEFNGERFETFRVIPRQHTQQMLPMVEALMSRAQADFSQLDAVAFGRGPGSFAGIRIATGCAQGIAYACGCDVLPVSTLESMALQVAEKTAFKHPWVAVSLDARMNEVYVAAYEVNNGLTVALSHERVCAPEDVILPKQDKSAQVIDKFVAAGAGWSYLSNMAEGVQRQIELMDEDYYPSAGAMLTLAQRDWDAGLAVAAHEAMPVYLRDDVAWKKKDQQ